MTAAAIRIGSRGSALAMAQATMLRDALAADGHDGTIVVIETAGDRRAPDTAWGEGAFVAAIERALLEGDVDVAVHSAKDIPTDEDPRLRIAAYLRRADPRDALVVRAGDSATRLADLPAGARVGTDSPRRTGFLRARRPDLRFHPLNGNVDTRLRRLDDGETDALVLACAGLERLRLGHRIAERFEAHVLPPAPGQGAIAVQVRAEDDRVLTSCAGIDDGDTRLAVEAERAFLRASGGGCRSPIGAHARVDDDRLVLVGGYARPDGSEVVIAERTSAADAGMRLGEALAHELRLADRLRTHPPEAASRVDASGDASTEPAPRVIVTRAAAQADELQAALRRQGLEPVAVPAIDVVIDAGDAVDVVAGDLATYAWIVITSANGVRAIVNSAERAGATHAAALRNGRFAAVGDATRAALERAGASVAFQPEVATARALAAGLPLRRGERLAVIRGDLAGDETARTLRARGADVNDVIAYRTVEGPDASGPLLRAALAGGPIAAIAFTSGSAVRGLARLAAAEGFDLRPIPAACIGHGTAAAAAAAGFSSIAVAARADSAALARAAAALVTRQLQEIA